MRMHDPESRRYVGDESAKCGPAIWMGGKFPLSGKMKEMKWLYRPDPGFHAINVMSLGKHMAAAASKLRIYHVKGRLPALRVSAPQRRERKIGILTERTIPSNGFGGTFGVRHERWESSRGFKPANTNENSVLKACKTLAWHLDTCEAYTEYLRFTGQNLHVMGCYQYDDKNTCFEPDTPTSRLQPTLRDVATRVFDANGISFYASVEFVRTMDLLRKSMAWQATSGQAHNPYCWVDKNGAQGTGVRGTGSTENWNFLHPEVEEQMLDVAETLARKYNNLPRFMGINWTAYFGGGWIPAYRTGKGEPFSNGYGDITIARFERETGIDIPVADDDTERFYKRYTFLISDSMKPVWAAWRCQKVRDFFAKVAARIQRHRVDLECVAGCYLNAYNHTQEWMPRGKSFNAYLGEWGWDPEMFDENQSLWLTGWLSAAGRHGPAFGSEGYGWIWQLNKSDEFYQAFDLGDRRSVMLNYNWLEIERVTALMPHKPDWPRPYQSTMQLQQAHDFAREPYAQAMIGCDPNLLMFGISAASLYVGQEQRLRSVARVLRHLPLDRFSRVKDTGFSSNLALRQLHKNETLYFYAVNPGYWPIRGTVTVSGTGAVRDATTGEVAISSENGETASLDVPVSLAPFGIAAFVATGESAKIHAWRTKPLPEKHLAHMRKILADAKASANIAGLPAFVGEAEFQFLTRSIEQAESALAGHEYARAWSILTHGGFWTLVYQKAEDMRTADLTRPKQMLLPKAAQDLRMDGRLDDHAWKRAQPKTGFVTADRKLAPYETRVMACHDGKFIYVAFDCRDANPDGIRATAKKERELFSSADDAVIVFLQPDPAKPEYFQLGTNAGGLVFDQACSGHARNYKFSPDWRVKTQINKNGWTAEMRIPVQALGGSLEAGSQWGVNFHRIFRDKLNPATSWSYQAANWHDVEKLGRMVVQGK